jgi:proton-dependent oligopeptide transporter, POT family
MSTNSATTAPSTKSDRYPPGIPYIVGNEGAERFSFYGMRAILYIYLTALFVQFAQEGMVPEAEMAAARAHGTEITHLFFAGVYLFPLIGAVLSDRLLGKYNVILFVSLVYCLGHGVLAVAGRMGAMGDYESAELGMYIGLSLIALGSGGIKPCVSANVGDQFTAENGHLISRIFQIFYFIINFGSFFSTLITPLLYRHIGPELAFGVPGILMGVATIVFWLGRKKFVLQPPKPGGKLGGIDFTATVLLFSPVFALIYGKSVMWDNFEAPEGVSGLALVVPAVGYFLPLLGVVALTMGVGFYLFSRRQKIKEDDGFLAVMVYSLRNRKRRGPGQTFFDPAREKFGREAGDGPPAVLRIMIVFSMVSFFWALFDQHASTWIEQARSMDLTITVPRMLGYGVVGATIVGAIYGMIWLMLHVSNVKIPRVINLAVLAHLLIGLLVTGLIDLFSGEMNEVTLDAAQVAALNPLMVMIIIPLINVGVWDPLRKRGIEVKPLRRMTAGMFLAALAFVAAALLQSRIEGAGVGEIPVLWQVVQYLIMTTAEVLVSVTGLEFAYTQAPRSMKSTIMGFWLLCVTFGNLIVAFLAPLQETYALSEFLWLFAGLMVIAAAIFAVLAFFYQGKSYLQQAEG